MYDFVNVRKLFKINGIYIVPHKKVYIQGGIKNIRKVIHIIHRIGS